MLFDDMGRNSELTNNFLKLASLRIHLRALVNYGVCIVDRINRQWLPRCLAEFIPNKPLLRTIEVLPWDLDLLVKAADSDDPQEMAELKFAYGQRPTESSLDVQGWKESRSTVRLTRGPLPMTSGLLSSYTRSYPFRYPKVLCISKRVQVGWIQISTFEGSYHIGGSRCMARIRCRRGSQAIIVVVLRSNLLQIRQ